MKKVYIFSTVAILFASVLMWTVPVNAARTDGLWNERFSSYVELMWAEGRNILIKGTNKYLNFGTLSGISGYGIRDNSGVMEVKDSGGSWSGIGTGSSGSSGFSTTSTDYWLTTKTTDNLTQGASNLYWSNALFDTRLGASSSLPSLSTLAGLTSFGIAGATTTALGSLIVDGQLKGVPTANYGNGASTGGAWLLNNTSNTGFGLHVYTNAGAEAIAAPVFVNVASSSNVYPAIRIDNAGTGIGLDINQTNSSNFQGGVRVNSANPDIEFVDTDEVSPAGKFEIGVRGDLFYVGTRNAAETGFDQSTFFTRVANGGVVGIGTSTPWAKLSVVQTYSTTSPLFIVASSTSGLGTTTALLIDAFGTTSIDKLAVTGTASSTFANGVNLTSGCFAISGVCIGGSSSGFSTTSTDYWLTTKTTDNLTQGATNLYWSDARFDARLGATTSLPKIGSLTGLGNIGSSSATTTALGHLSIAGNVNLTGGLLGIVSGNASNDEKIIRIFNSSAAERMSFGYDATNVGLKLNNRSGVALYTFAENGNMGVGTDTPYAKLSVNGQTVAKNFVATSSTSTFAGITTTGLAITGAGTTTSANGIDLTSGCFSIGGTCIGGTGGSLSGGTAGMLSAWTSSSALTATGTPTAAAYVATSTTGTSTFAGAITIKGYSLATSTTVCIQGQTCQYPTSGTAGNVAIQAAIDEVHVAGGGRVLIKAGTYTWASSATVNLYDNIELVGEGPATKLVTAATTKGLFLATTTNVSIHGLQFDGSNQNQGPFNGDESLVVRNSHNVHIYDNTFTNQYGFAILVDSTNNVGTGMVATTSGVIISNNYLECNGRQDCIGGGPQTTGDSTTTDVTITGNTIFQTAYAGSVENSTSDLNCFDLVAVQNMTVTNNNCHGQMVFGTEQTPNQYSLISGNTIDAPRGPVVASGDIVLITNNTPSAVLPGNITITGNTLRSGKINVTGASPNIYQNILITGNNITTATSTAQNYNSVGAYGIYLNTVNGATVSNNVVTAYSTQSTSTGIMTTSVTNTTVSNNTIRDFAGSGGTGVYLSSDATNKMMLNTYINDATGESNSNNTIVFTGINFGIGTSSPYSKLSVAGQVVAANYIATNTSATSSFQNTSITGAVSILGEYFTNFTNYVRSLFTAGNGITITSGSVAVNAKYTTGKLRFSYASSTQGAATTTRYLGPAPYNLTLTTAQCDFSNWMQVSIYDGTNRANMIKASSTVGTTTFATNNTFTQGESMRVDIGTSTNVGAAINGGCTIKYTY